MSYPHPSTLRKVLALDTSTDRLSVALGDPHAGAVLAQHDGPGGAQASTHLIPTLQRLLAQVGWQLAELDAIAFGCGPGAFTGLRTACAVVQGLAVAARPDGIPVLPMPTLLLVAEQARQQALDAGTPLPPRVVAVLDARMDELYVAEWAYTPTPDGRPHWQAVGTPWLTRPEQLQLADGWPAANDQVPPATATNVAPLCLVGNALATYGPRLAPAWHTVPQREAWPTAQAALRLAPAWWAQGLAVPAAAAQPLYVRDKVAQTTAERAQAKAAPQA